MFRVEVRWRSTRTDEVHKKFWHLIAHDYADKPDCTGAARDL